MISIILALLIIVFAALYYFGIFKTQQLIKFYSKQFEINGFRVLNYEFKQFKYSQIEAGMAAQKKSRDTMSITKQVASQFDVSITNLVHKVQINLISPKLMQSFFEADQDRYYQKSQFFVGGLRRAFGTGITLSTGPIWKHKRKIVTKMLNFNYIKDLVPRIQKIVQKKTEQYFNLIKKSQINQDQYYEVDVLQITTIIASTTMLQLFFGGSNFNVNQMKINNIKVNDFVRYLFELLLKQLMSPLTMILGKEFTKLGLRKNDRDLNAAIIQFRNFTHSFIVKRLDQLKIDYKEGRQIPQVYTDLIEAFYCEQIIKENKQITNQFIQELINDFGMIYVAGTDTTSHNAQVSLYYIIKNPSVLNKLKKQIAQHIKDLNSISFQDLKNLVYLQATIMQSLRVYSSANGIFPREAKQDHALKIDKDHSIFIKKGTIVNTQTFPIHYKETVYKNPHQFMPQRFINNENKIISPEPYTWMNFSAGPRSCIGKQLALTEMKIIIITLLSLYDFKLDDSNKLFHFKEFAFNLSNVKFEARSIKTKTS